MGLRALRAAETALRADTAAKAPVAGAPAEDSPARIARDRVRTVPGARRADAGAPAKSPELVLLASIHALATEGMEHDSAERPPSRYGRSHLLDNGESVVDYDFESAIEDLRGRLERIARAAAGSAEERLAAIHRTASDALGRPGFDAAQTEADKLARYAEHATALLDIGRRSDLPAPDQVIETLCRQVADAEQAVESVTSRREPLRKEFVEAQTAARAVPFWKKCLGFGLLQAKWYERKAARLAETLAGIEDLERAAREVLGAAKGMQDGATASWKLADAEQLAKHAALIGAQLTSVAHRAMAAAADAL